MNHGAEDRAKDIFFVTYEVGSDQGFCMGVKVKCLSSVSVLDTSGETCELRPVTKILYSVINCRDPGAISLMTQMSVTKLVTKSELQ